MYWLQRARLLSSFSTFLTNCETDLPAPDETPGNTRGVAFLSEIAEPRSAPCCGCHETDVLLRFVREPRPVAAQSAITVPIRSFLCVTPRTSIVQAMAQVGSGAVLGHAAAEFGFVSVSAFAMLIGS